jgi:tetratricopeptide (TPR) repeat protein
LILQQAQLALGADTLAALAARWRTRASRDSGDQLARLGLAMTAVLTADSAEAERALDGLLDAGTSRAPVAAPIARYARYGQGLLYYAIGQWEAAVRALTEAADAMRAANDSAGEAQSLVNLVWLEARSHRPTASAHLARADSLIPPGAGQLRGAWHCADAALLSAHHAAGAVEAADSGAAIAHRVGDPRLAAQCEFAAAQDLAGRGRFDDALPRFGEVIALAARTRDHGVHAAALQWRGFGELNMGHYGPAENDLLAAVAEASAHGYQAGVGWGELNLAAIAEQLGDVVGARRHAARSLAALSIIGDSAGLGILRRSDARRALAVGDTATARASARVALQAAEHHGRLEDVVGARLELAAVDVHENRWDSAAKELAVQRPLLAADRAQGWARILPWYEGRVSLGRGDPRTALQQFQRADLTLDSTQHLFRDQLHADIAVALLRTGDTAGALEALQQSERELETWRATLDDAGLRVLAFSATDILPGPPGGDAEVIAAAARSQRIATGFALAERQRARELADQLVRAQALGTDGRAPVGVRPGSRPTGATPISLAQLQGALPDDSTALLEYVTGDGGAPTTLFAVTRRHVWTWIEPPVDSLVETIDRLDALVDHGANAAAPERTLGLALLGKIGALPSTIQRLVIVPDGPLHRVPFSALRLAGGDLVLEHYAVSLAPSATVVVAEWRRPAVVRTATVLAFGDPVLPPDRHEEEGDGIADRDAASALAAAGGLPRLPWTADEAALVGSFAPHSTVRLRTDASATFLEQTPLAAFSILHFATHAVVDEEVPARSALALAAGGGRSGYVGPADLAALHLTANLVVLSACRTARGAVVTGEGVRGLTSPLLAAGAHSVLATQWRLNDRDAVSLVYTLYLEMAAGLPIAEAVRRAELAARRAGRPEREWAAFILVGDPLVRIPLRAPAPAQVPSWVRHYDVAGS